MPAPHCDLHTLRLQLQDIHTAIVNFEPLTVKPPILDSSADSGVDSSEDSQWLQPEHVPGLRNLRDAVKKDLDVLERFLADPGCASLPALSTNAPYLIAVWNEILSAPPPVVSIFKTFLSQPKDFPADRSRRRGDQQPSAQVKVDVVADNGRQWIRINTVKNSRMLAEFREIDSYLTGSEDSGDESLYEEHGPSLAQTEFDNSILRMGRSLLAAAKENPIPGANELPQVILRLTRLEPSPIKEKGQGSDHRLAMTVKCLQDMGVDVQLGERLNVPVPVSMATSPPGEICLSPRPTRRINLDLSVLIALVSDLTHSPLPKSAGEANTRFVPPKTDSHREWKKKRPGINENGNVKSRDRQDVEVGEGDTKDDLGKHSRQLSNQVLQEMGKGMLQEIFDRISTPPQKSSTFSSAVEFWTTVEARDRCLRITCKIGGPNEKRRAQAMFPEHHISIQEAEDAYWLDSRYPRAFIPLLPIHLHPSSEPGLHFPDADKDSATLPPFFKALAQTCSDILSQETIPHPRALPESFVEQSAQIQRATVTKANPRLTAHTVQSMLWGAELGWTTLTANKTSVKALMREMRAGRREGRLERDSVHTKGENGKEMAAIWIVDPRSLAEGMRGA